MGKPSSKSENDKERTRQALSSVCCSVLQRVAACCRVCKSENPPLRVRTIKGAQQR